MTSQIPQSRPTAESLLLRQVGEVLFGSSWQAELAKLTNVADRTMRRWASGEDPIPPGIWREIHEYAQGQWLTIKYFDEEMVKLINASQLQPITNAVPMPDSWGLHFALHTRTGRPVRCFLSREVLDDRVPSSPFKNVLNYFQDHASTFYEVAQRKFDANDIENGTIVIRNIDVEDKYLPDIRCI
ncbi:DUF1488 family protein [Bradyrhizobium nitroreducens]|uniref:DUF1488 family protein n=1 Tax=Bradyrhizobium nitroreducens TaxID=709803 RepID=UPI000C1F0A2F|nr:DUF1488 family protein [Bradyrhizobium nitroreducens]